MPWGILATTSSSPVAVIAFFTAQPGILKIIAQGETKASVILAGGIQCDLRVVSDAEFPYALAYFTGSKEHNIVMRQRAIARGLRLNEYGLFKSKEETRDPQLRVACQTEEEIFATLNLPYVPPEIREDHGEFAAAEKNALPKLIEWTQLKGALHNHSNWSDGKNTLAEMAEEARVRVRGHRRDGIDATKKLHKAGDITEDEMHDIEAEIQKFTDKFVKHIDDSIARKEADIMKI